MRLVPAAVRRLITLPSRMVSTRAKVVLVVEDDPQQRTLYARILGMAGYTVLQAGDSTQALAQVHAVRPDLVLMDVTLPGPSGWNATREIKSHPDTHRIPVLVITGRVGFSDRDASFASGSDSFLEKPVLPQRLLAEVARLLGVGGEDSSPAV